MQSNTATGTINNQQSTINTSTIMKSTILIILFGVTVLYACYSFGSIQGRDFAYENYCDSIWVNDPDYYIDVLLETDQYLDYIDKHGIWWNE